jgi:NAD(P)H-hydrate epimerase
MTAKPIVLSRAQVRAADARAVRDLGVPAACLMENAGRGLADVTIESMRLYGVHGAVVVCARGNNGGDGLVAARHLRVRGVPVRVLLATPAASFVPDSDPGRNLVAVRALGIPIDEAPGGAALERIAPSLPRGHLLVDAVLGTGLEGPVRGPLAEVLAWLAASGRPIVAADLPSGLDADTGELLGPVPRCAATATFLALKRGLLEGRGPEVAGRVTVCDIGVPADLVAG